jgi:hypothetical protein
MRLSQASEDRWLLTHAELGIELEIVYVLGKTWAFWWHGGRVVSEAIVGDA